MLNVDTLHRNYRDCRRWRLAALVCEELRAGDGASSHQRDTEVDDIDYSNPLERLTCNGGRKWFLHCSKSANILIKTSV
ncbi:hypothetical protein diail_8454 [Diaporthe ilicicola]|nr:hypothetical protein diail_8454 [Diaporthe ilicicola]